MTKAPGLTNHEIIYDVIVRSYGYKPISHVL